jgi:hypothetical protein
VSAQPPPGYRTQSEDTSYAAEQLLFERWRAMDLDAKAALVAQASRDLHRLCIAGLAHRLAGAGPHELEMRARALEYGKELVQRVLGVDVPAESIRIP